MNDVHQVLQTNQYYINTVYHPKGKYRSRAPHLFANMYDYANRQVRNECVLARVAISRHCTKYTFHLTSGGESHFPVKYKQKLFDILLSVKPH